jgi:hypothetical protein
MLEQQTNYNGLDLFVNLYIFRLKFRSKPDLEPDLLMSFT